MRPGAVRAVLLACLLAVLAAALRREHGERADQGERARAARRRGRDLRPAVERRVPVRHAHAVAAGRPGLGGVAGGLRRAAADLPGRRLAHAERRRPGAVRPHQRRLRGVPRGDPRRHRRRGAGHGLAGGLQQPVPQQPQLGPAGAEDPGLRHRRRPGRRAGARRPDRARRLVPALGRGSHRGGAGPLPADRRGPGKSSDMPNGPRPSPRWTPNSRGSRRTCRPARRCSSPRPGPPPSRRTCSSPWSTAPATRPAC